MTKLGHLHSSTVNYDLQRFSRPIFIFISSLHLSHSHTEQGMANAGWQLQLFNAVMLVKRELYPTLDWHTRADSPTPSYKHTHTHTHTHYISCLRYYISRIGAHASATLWRKELLKCDCYDILLKHKHAEIEIERERVLINRTARVPVPEAMERWTAEQRST